MSDDEKKFDDDDSDDVQEPVRKGRRMTPSQDRRSAGSVIGEAVCKLVELEAAKLKTSVEGPFNENDRVASAIAILLEAYSHLDGDVLANLADILAEGLNATSFIALKGAARDSWVTKKSSQ